MARSRATRNLSDFGFLGFPEGLQNFMATHAAEYKIDAAREELTLKERKIGHYGHADS